ncbi:MAG: CHAP domain-containing protein [Clostridia bacterium]|nr:CHAP domain-containing protein [Clostridia bacterium]
MKRWIALLLLISLLPLPALAASKTAKQDDALPEKLTLTAGKFQTFTPGFTGTWESSNPKVARAEKDVTNEKRVRITALKKGKATLTLTGTRTKKVATVEVTVKAEKKSDEVPELIQSAIDIGIQEWTEAAGKAFSQQPKNNKFTKWWGYACGWCGAFANYCLATAGVPMEPSDTYKKVKPTKTGEPHSLREAAVPKLDTGFTNMERITKIPRPGYLVIYGQKNSYAFKHVGLVTEVKARGSGVYEIHTVEGNLGNRIKRMCYLYDLRAPDNANMSTLPEEEQTQPDVYQYAPHQKNWYVTEFCQTWY